MNININVKCNVEKVIEVGSFYIIEGWIFCADNLRNAAVQKLRLKLSDSRIIECETTSRPDVSLVHELNFANSGFHVQIPSKECLGMVDIIELMVDNHWYKISNSEFFVRGFMWLCSNPSISDASLVHDIGNYETRLQGNHLKDYLKILIDKIKKESYPSEICGQIISTSFYQIGFDSIENFQNIHSISNLNFPLECKESSRWYFSVHTAKVHCMLFHGFIAEAKSTLEHLRNEFVGKFEYINKSKEVFIYYNFCKSQLILSLLYFMDGDREKCAATCLAVRDTAFQAASALPRTYSMAAEIRDIMLCAQQAVVLSYQCGINDGSLDYPEPLNVRTVLSVSLRVSEPDVVQIIQKNLGI